MGDADKRKRGPARSVWEVLSYGIRRPLRDVRENAGAVREQWGRFRSARQARDQASSAQREDYQRRTSGLSPKERFHSEAARGGWTEEDLVHQERAARIGRRACLGACAVGFVASLAVIFTATPMFAFIFGLVTIALLAAFFAQAVRNAWWEFELQGRVLIPLSDFLARPDLFRRLFS